MKRLTIVPVFLILMSGCTLHRPFVKSVDQYLDVILPEYRVYIQEDAQLNEDTKRIRTQTADRLDSLINDAVKESDHE